MEGRCLWIKPDDVDGPLDEGHVVTATRPLADFCLRGDAGSSPIAPGTLLEVVETRPWGAAMAQELPELHAAPVDTSPATIMQAMLDLEGMGLWEFRDDTAPEVTASSGDIEMVTRAVEARR